MIDEIDRKILSIIQGNARTSNAEIARQVGMAPSAILERIRKLEDKSIIEGYTVKLNPRSLGAGQLAFVFVRTNDRVGEGETARLLAEIPGVEEVHDIAGEDCYLVKVRAANTESIGRLLRERFGPIKSITSTRTTIVLETIKETGALPLTAPPAGEKDQ